MVNVHVMLFFVVAVTVVAVRFWKGSDFSLTSCQLDLKKLLISLQKSS